MSSHIDSPRKILDLGIGIAASVSLTNSGIVAFLTSRPARIAIEPGTSGGGDPIELPRIAAQDIALLSKEFALVLDKEGTVWSVPLADPTRVREIVRDMRAICARPTGDSALSISEDGKVFILSLGRGEVGARPVDVPGRTRAIHASDGATSLVAEGDEGGQLRFYGSTMLDRGPTSRVVLPRQAADFDYVRGGRVLSVMFKRGGTSLCVVMRDEARAEVKMIGLASAVTDVAVTDGSIVAVMVDGSLALYDIASVVAASEGFVAPVQAVALGSSGRPRVALATTIKGTTSIWIGTTTGEVMRASLAEGAVPAKTSKEEPVVTRPANSEVEMLRKELEELRSALGTGAAELQSRTNERDQLQASLEAKAVELQSRSDELQARTDERDELQAALEAKAVELQSRSDELHTRTSERDELQASLDAKAVELQSRSDELHTRTSERDELQASLDAKAVELQSRSDELHTRTSERDKLQASLDAKAVELRSRSDELHTRTDERDELRASLEAKAVELQSRSDELHTRTNERDQLQAALEAKAVELQSRSDELHTRTDERDELRASLEAKAVELQSRSDELHTRTDERDELQAALEAKAVELQSRSDELHTRTSERDTLQAALEAKAVELQSRSDELHTRTNERDQLQAALEAKAVELQSRSDELHTRTSERDQLQASLEAKAVELQSRSDEREQILSESAALQASATAVETRANELDAKLSKTVEAHDALRDELERMKTELVRQRNDFEASRAKRIETGLPERIVDGLDIVASLLGRHR